MIYPYSHLKRADDGIVASLPAKGLEKSLQLAALPGTAMEKLVVSEKEPEETPFRGAEDLKAQFFGPTLFNKQRLWELGDTAMYQGAYAIPAALAGGIITNSPMGLAAGAAIGKLMGQTHLFKKEKDRLEAAKKYFTKNEKKLLKDIASSGRNWSIGTALLAGLGAGGLAYYLDQDRFGKVLTPVLAAGGAASLGTLIGTHTGQYLARRRALKDPRFKAIIERYS
jgi:hypothetical protein